MLSRHRRGLYHNTIKVPCTTQSKNKRKKKHPSTFHASRFSTLIGMAAIASNNHWSTETLTRRRTHNTAPPTLQHSQYQYLAETIQSLEDRTVRELAHAELGLLLHAHKHGEVQRGGGGRERVRKRQRYNRQQRSTRLGTCCLQHDNLVKKKKGGGPLPLKKEKKRKNT